MFSISHFWPERVLVLAVVAFVVVEGSTMCPPFSVEYDRTTLTSFAKFSDGGMFGPLQSDPRVPLRNFQFAFPQCFPDVEFAAPLVAGTTPSSSGASTLVLPYSRNPPPGQSSCREDDLMGRNYCNDFATLVVGYSCEDKEWTDVTPANPATCTAPQCYPCASDPTGLGVSAAQIGSCYFDERTGHSLSLYACYPNLGCTSHGDCAVSQATIANKDIKQTPYGLLLTSTSGQAVQNNSVSTNPFAGYACCSYDPNFPICGFQNVRCDCAWCGGALGMPSTSFLFENGDRKNANDASYTLANPSMACSNAYDPAAHLFYVGPSEGAWKSGDAMWYQVTQVARGVDRTAAPSQATVTGGRTAPGGATPSVSACEDPANAPPYRCIRIFNEVGERGDVVAMCTTLTGGVGAWGRLESAIRQKNLVGSNSVPWWGLQKWEGGKAGNWNADIKSFVVSQCTSVTFFQNTRFRGNEVTVSVGRGQGCRCTDISSASGCCPEINFSVSSLLIKKTC